MDWWMGLVLYVVLASISLGLISFVIGFIFDPPLKRWENKCRWWLWLPFFLLFGLAAIAIPLGGLLGKNIRNRMRPAHLRKKECKYCGLECKEIGEIVEHENTCEVKLKSKQKEAETQKRKEEMNKNTKKRAVDYNTTYNTAGFENYQLGNLKSAIADYTKAIELDPENALAYYNRGFAKYANGEQNGAKKDIDIAHDLNPRIFPNYETAEKELKRLERSG
jgi:tetratricopeptide (TPR) repeat protein